MGKKKKIKLTPDQKAFRKLQRRFRTQITSVFKTVGFRHIPTRDKEIQFKGCTGEFDGIFIFENLVVITEDTCANKSGDIRDHLLKKNLFYQQLFLNKDEFVTFLENTFPEFKSEKNSTYQAADIKLVIAYCTKSRMEDDHKKSFADLIFMEDRHIQYFSALAKTLGKSARFELFKFLKLKTDDIGIATGEPTVTYGGFILPESPSGFPSGFKVVTFYIDPDALLLLSYVLRKDGWGDSENLYQRMISRNKIKSMRQFLGQEDRVFINNVIVSLPSATKILDKANQQIDIHKITKTTPIKVQITKHFNTIGIIDGQHRVFAYHEGYDDLERQIASKRIKQQLLVTGVVYPESVTEDKQHEFEARLFLEINDKQTKTKAELRQAIESIVNPFSVVAISKSVITKLAAKDPLCGYLEEHQFDRGKLKSSSIVSYGIRHIVKCEGEDSLFNLWRHDEKESFAAAVKAASVGKKTFTKPSKQTLESYVQFCAQEINNILIGYKLGVIGISKDLWTADRKESRAINTTAINGVIFCLRKMLQEKKATKTLEEYKILFKKLSVDFTPKKFKYRSSHWKSLGEKIYEQCFA